MSRDGDDRSVFGDGSLQETFDFGVRLHGSFLGHEVDFILDDDDVLDACNFKRHEMFTGLWLRARLVRGNHQHGSVHD